jgi:GDP-D-mannose 3', 5'-epimerase
LKKVVVLGGGGFIGGHVAKKLKEDGAYVRICDNHEYFDHKAICNEFILAI